jgi:putative ABC transport system permease protein
MNFSESFRTALRALAANKLRAILTMLGIVIGVGAVVALMAVGRGATAAITSQVQGIGANLISIFGGRFRQGGQPTIGVVYYQDYEALHKGLKNVAGIAPEADQNGTITYGKESLTSQVTATTPDFAKVRAYEVERGRFITEADRAHKARVVVLGAQTAKDLFGGLSPIGRTLKINGIGFEVVGLLKSKGSSGGFGNADQIIIVPLETGYAKLAGANSVRNGKLLLSSISLSAASAEVVDEVMVQAERILRRQHKLKLTDDLDFSVLSQSQFLSALSTITTTLTLFLGFIGVISLVVGGIGVMNIMLVSVTERTKEIGLRKAVGAKQRAIMLQFLIETLVLTFIGGVLGTLLGWGISQLVSLTGQLQPQVDIATIATAFTVTAVVGLLSGLYPAFRASRLRPIEALRYE